MGVDVLLYAECEPSAEVLERAEAFFVERCTVADRYVADGQIKWLAMSFEEACEWHAARVEARVTCRYYGPGYERGHWPDIFSAIVLLQSLFPEAKVFYGGDTDDTGIECTDEYMAEIWQHWAGPHGDDYHGRKR